MTRINKKIGNITFDNPFFLAPLAGVTDEAMRIICKNYGAAMMYTEMISAKGLFYGDRKSKDMINISEIEKPVGIQMFGSVPSIMAEAVKILEPLDAALIDINMGCPVPKIVKNGEGSALLKKVDLIYDIIEKLVKVSDKPITAKIRMGFDEDNINAVIVAKAVEAAGASAVAVHGRTREQFYSGKADWDIIRKVKEEISIPVIGNGDIHSACDGIRMIEETGCDFIMVARGALGNPWIFRELKAAYEGNFDMARPTIQEKKDVMLRHFDLIAINKGENIAVREMRKHIGWYTKGIPNSSSFRNKVNNIDSALLLRKAIKDIRQ